MTRIIAGVAGGRRITVPEGKGTRPTSDRAREGLFSTLASLLGPLEGVRVLDLYAGSGAVGLEALSRGAGHALLVDADAKAVSALRRNVAALGLPGAEVRADRAERVVAVSPRAPYDAVFADPPYAMAVDAVTAVMVQLVGNGWLATGSIVAVERSSRADPWCWPDGIEPVRERRYGEGTLWYGRRASGAAAQEA
jgi:16S rRNA (guanine966-N2)-methyltransferase